jgi:hypothetical protein
MIFSWKQQTSAVVNYNWACMLCT